MNTSGFLFRRVPLMAALVCSLLSLAHPAFAANEKALWAIWQRQIQTPDDHAALLAGCKNFLTANRQDPLVPVVKTLAAWHLLKLDQQDAAVKLMEPYLATESADPVVIGARQVCRDWTTRLDREQVKDALQAYYRKEVRYPNTLKEVAGHPELAGKVSYRPADRWGLPWSYRAKGFKGLSGFQGQSYDLTSSRLGEYSDIGKALELTYGSLIQAKPTKVFDAGGRGTTVQLALPGGANTAIAVGKQDKGLYVAYAGTGLVIMCDANHWIVFRKP